MSERQIVIVANGGANIASLQFALQRLEVPSAVSANADEIRAASHVVPKTEGTDTVSVALAAVP